MRRRGRLWCFIVLLALAGPVAPAYAAEEAWPSVSRVWAWLESWLLGGSGSATSDQGPWIDPNGGSSATSEQSLFIDPDGASSATSDQGFSIDPNG